MDYKKYNGYKEFHSPKTTVHNYMMINHRERIPIELTKHGDYFFCSALIPKDGMFVVEKDVDFKIEHNDGLNIQTFRSTLNPEIKIKEGIQYVGMYFWKFEILDEYLEKVRQYEQAQQFIKNL